MIKRLRASRIGPIRHADISFGDLTVFVGPQATGKSIFLQLVKLIEDKSAVHNSMRRFGLHGSNDATVFLDRYFGEGMSSIWSEEDSSLTLGNSSKKISLTAYAKARKTSAAEKMFYIPAQRVMSLRDGMTRPFTDYRAGDPYVLRDFSEKLHGIVQNEFGLDKEVFPKAQRLSEVLRHPVEEHIFGKFKLRTDSSRLQGRLILKDSHGSSLPFLVWSAGQREFVPLLLGLYWLLPASRVACRDEITSVVIEEPEMGLHPNGISAVICLILELRSRGYRVYVSTHSPHMLDIVWALNFLQAHNGSKTDVLKLLSLRSNPKTQSLAQNVLSSSFKTYYFSRDGSVSDISNLDPGSDNDIEGGWGGLTEFSSRVGNVVAEVAERESAVSS